MEALRQLKDVFEVIGQHDLPPPVGEAVGVQGNESAAKNRE